MDHDAWLEAPALQAEAVYQWQLDHAHCEDCKFYYKAPMPNAQFGFCIENLDYVGKEDTPCEAFEFDDAW